MEQQLTARRLAGLRAVITGSSSGIGEAIARRYSREGAKIIAHYNRRHGSATRLVKDIQNEGGEAVALAADLSSSEQLNSLVERLLGKHGMEIDIWVNNAGADILTENTDDADETTPGKAYRC